VKTAQQYDTSDYKYYRIDHDGTADSYHPPFGVAEVETQFIFDPPLEIVYGVDEFLMDIFAVGGGGTNCFTDDMLFDFSTDADEL
jgi:hypothetical protein